jgi:hypothetical protein
MPEYDVAAVQTPAGGWTSPPAKAQKRFVNGKEDDLVFYYEVLKREWRGDEATEVKLPGRFGAPTSSSAGGGMAYHGCPSPYSRARGSRSASRCCARGADVTRVPKLTVVVPAD